jgi:hypothetical protein
MKNKWLKNFFMVGTMAAMLFSASVPAFAFVDESAVLEESFTGEEVQAEDTEAETADTADTNTTAVSTTEAEAAETDSAGTAGDAFSVSGNATVLDQVADASGKEFYTIQTANNNTYFMVIDHASSSDNVYMLSMIDENDLKGFLEEESETEAAVTQPSVIFEEETTEEAEVQVEETANSETPQKTSQVGTLAILALLGAAVAGGYYYLKFYKPKKDGDFSDDEDLEYLDEETVNEDEMETSSEKDHSEEEASEEDDEDGFDIEDDEY